MKITKKSPNFYGINFLLGALVFFMLFFFLRALDLKKNRPDSIRTRIENVLAQKEKKTEKWIDLLQNGNNGSEPGVAIFVYRGDTLERWTGNAVPWQARVLDRQKLKAPVIRLENGIYRVLQKNAGNQTFLAFILIFQDYPFQNDYLTNGLPQEFGVPSKIHISTYHGKHDIKSSDGTFLFSFSLDDENPPARWPWILFLLFIGGFIFTIFFICKLYKAFEYIFPGKTTFILALIADLVIVRAAQFYFRWPRPLYETPLFSPDFYFGSSLVPSFGDLMVNALLILSVALVIYTKWPAKQTAPPARRSGKYLWYILAPLTIALATGGIAFIIRTLVKDSTIPLDLQDLTALNGLSLAAFGVIAILFLSLYLLAAAFARRLAQGEAPGSGKPFLTGFSGVLIFLILSAALSTIILNDANVKAEREQRKMIAMKLAARRNPYTEEMFAETDRKIAKDSLLQARILSLREGDSEVADQVVAKEISDKYFSGYWNNFSVQVTLCRAGKMLKIQPQDYLTPCREYFERIIREFGVTTSSDDLWYLDYGYGNENYLARMLPPETGLAIYIEFSLKQAYKDLGYPELLVDRSVSDLPDLSGYTYGYYQDGQLVRRVGQYAYGFELGTIDPASEAYFFNSGGYNHYFYRIDQKNVMLIGKPNPSLLSRISPFSYLFISFAVFSLLFYIFFRFRRLRSLVTESLRNRLQVAILGIILASFIMVGVVVTVFLVRLNAEKDKENLLERALSILVEMQHKFGSVSDLGAVPPGEMGNQLIKFSNVFFSDINIYGRKGVLVASSRPQVFDEGLISGLMNPEALEALRNGSESMIVRNEMIGKHRYLSAYIPMYNDRNERAGYINLPYFSRQAELRGEVSAFMVAFINIYVLFILLGVIIAFLIAGYLTAPLKMLAQKISRTSLGKTNEKIEWKRQDEVGRLVAEYNRMLDELSESAGKLASSERESAWREMARQVAHEIKNPLTPMKLGVQYLGKSWDEKAPDWDQRLKRFSAALIEQIDSLSSIASEFSDFAKMPDPMNEKLELNEVIQSSLSLYRGVAPVRFDVISDGTEKFVFCDRKQLLRILNNLLNNAIQAIGQDEGGHICFTLKTVANGYEIDITDNGPGIPADQAGKIFHPNFTTKSGGTGLGLAIVREIVTSQGGTISFISNPGTGTTFIIILPTYETQSILPDHRRNDDPVGMFRGT